MAQFSNTAILCAILCVFNEVYLNILHKTTTMEYVYLSPGNTRTWLELHR